MGAEKMTVEMPETFDSMRISSVLQNPPSRIQDLESRAGCSSSRANPFFMVHSPDASESIGSVYGFNLIYSGNHYAAIEVNAFGKTRIVNGIQPEGFEWILQKGEEFEAPESVMTYSPHGFTGQSENMHKFVSEHIVRGKWKNVPRPVLLNS